MALGFPASHSEYLPLNNLKTSFFMAIAVRVCENLNWKISELNESGIIVYSKASKNSWEEKISIHFDEDVAVLKSSCIANQIADFGKNKKNIDAFTELFYYTKKAISLEELEELEKKIVSNTSEVISNFENDGIPKRSGFYNWVSVFIPTDGYFVTPILIYLNIFVLILMCFSGVSVFLPENQDLINWGANYSPMTTDGEWWRLLSNIFIHIGFFHLVMNVFALAYVGLLLEPYLGKTKFLIAYLFTGVLASLTSLYWNHLLLSAGASGAIFGMYGIFIVFLLGDIIDRKIKSAILSSIVLFIVLNLVTSFKEGIDGAAHFGGFFSGILIGLGLIVFIKKPYRYGVSSLFLFTAVFVFFFAYHIRNNSAYVYDVFEYDKKMQDFVEMEAMALEAYGTDCSPANKEHALYMIKERGIYYWDENIKLIEEVDQMYLPKNLHERNDKMIEYCKLRIKSYKILYKAVNEQTNRYIEESKTLLMQIEKLAYEIKNNYN
jgi:rhomboid protease GluP